MSEPVPTAFELPDVNVLVALTNPAHQHHRQAHEWLVAVPLFATTPLTEAGLVRLLLNPAVTGQRVSGQQAVAILAGLRRDRRAMFVPDPSSLAAAEIDLVGLAGHQQVTDLHLVNLAASQDGRLATFDRKLRTALALRDQRYVHEL